MPFIFTVTVARYGARGSVSYYYDFVADNYMDAWKSATERAFNILRHKGNKWYIKSITQNV